MNKLPFSKYIEVEGLIFLSGQVHLRDGELVGDTVAEKTKIIMENIGEVLKEAGASLDKVIKSTVYVTDMGFYTEFNEEYVKHFSGEYPAREVVCVKALPLGADIEISVVARK